METQTPREIFKETVRQNPENGEKNLLELTTQKARWFKKQQVVDFINEKPDLFEGENLQEKLEDAVRMHMEIWGRDARVLFHCQIIAMRARETLGLTEEERKLLELACYFHDLAEGYLNDVCDVESGKKTQEQKDFEKKMTQKILTDAGIESEQKEILMKIINKEGKLGEILKEIELSQFYITATRTQKKLKKIEELKYKNKDDEYVPIPKQTHDFWIQSSTSTIEDVIRREMLRRNKKTLI
jgi:hypothetical protein